MEERALSHRLSHGHRVRRSLPLILFVSLVLSACGGGESGPTFTQGDIGEIVLQPSEAPGATEHDHDATGQPALSEPLDTPAIEALTAGDAGYVDAVYAEFKVPGSTTDPDYASAASLVVIFEDAGAAEAGYEVVLEDSRVFAAVEGYEQPISGVVGTERPAEGLGQEGAIFEGEFFHGEPGAFYVWRVGNLVLMAAGQGFDVDEIGELAETMDSRAV